MDDIDINERIIYDLLAKGKIFSAALSIGGLMRTSLKCRNEVFDRCFELESATNSFLCCESVARHGVSRDRCDKLFDKLLESGDETAVIRAEKDFLKRKATTEERTKLINAAMVEYRFITKEIHVMQRFLDRLFPFVIQGVSQDCREQYIDLLLEIEMFDRVMKVAECGLSKEYGNKLYNLLLDTGQTYYARKLLL